MNYFMIFYHLMKTMEMSGVWSDTPDEGYIQQFEAEYTYKNH